ncbi:MAG: hypothetical protein HUU56_17950 [Bdellovibrionaceae bacterium]|nr:hypothetical protein [Pseudobdellovibrionaceae bacterium]
MPSSPQKWKIKTRRPIKKYLYNKTDILKNKEKTPRRIKLIESKALTMSFLLYKMKTVSKPQVLL